MSTCRTCRHWEQFEDYNPSVDNEILGDWGRCMLTDCDEPEHYDTSRMMVYSLDRYSLYPLYTSPSFGCVLWSVLSSTDTDRGENTDSSGEAG